MMTSANWWETFHWTQFMPLVGFIHSFLTPKILAPCSWTSSAAATMSHPKARLSWPHSWVKPSSSTFCFGSCDGGSCSNSSAQAWPDQTLWGSCFSTYQLSWCLGFGFPRATYSELWGYQTLKENFNKGRQETRAPATKLSLPSSDGMF